MELMTLKQYAESQNISYEAVRKQVVRYADDLSDHIIKKNRKQFLDEYAVDFLTERRRESPIILTNMNQSEENQRLKEQIETLRTQLMTAQNELLKSQDERLKAQERIIELQDEAKKTLEDRAKYTALLEDNKLKEERLKEAGDRIESLRKKTEEDQKVIEDLQKETQSFTKSIFGFYRKL